MRLTALLWIVAIAEAQQPALQPFLRPVKPVFALRHVVLIDGTGSEARPDQTIVVENGIIRAAGDTARIAIPQGAEVLDLNGHTVIPGLVGMHEHLFYPSGRGVPIYNEHAYSFPRMYLASGVTTARTGGGLEVQTDLAMKKQIDEGRAPGPKMHVTAGYLEGPGSFTPQMLELRGPADAKSFVEYWANLGATSFKAYMHVTRGQLEAAITAAHARGLKLTGHLCSVGFREAAAMGIDNLEHGIVVDGELSAAKQPDQCPQVTPADLARFDPRSGTGREIIGDLVRHHVAITSTLAVFEVAPPLEQRFLDALSHESALNYLAARERLPEATRQASALRVKKEAEFEREFFKAGGLLMAGADPTGNGSALAGFADQRNLELLVAGGFTPVEAVKIATLNGAKWLGLEDRIGSIATGRQADLVVVEGDPSARISDIRNVRIVFKDGVGFDPVKLLESVRGHVGLH